jgi:hypothetical protein
MTPEVDIQKNRQCSMTDTQKKGSVQWWQCSKKQAVFNDGWPWTGWGKSIFQLQWRGACCNKISPKIPTFMIVYTIILIHQIKECHPSSLEHKKNEVNVKWIGKMVPLRLNWRKEAHESLQLNGPALFHQHIKFSPINRKISSRYHHSRKRTQGYCKSPL